MHTASLGPGTVPLLQFDATNQFPSPPSQLSVHVGAAVAAEALANTAAATTTIPANPRDQRPSPTRSMPARTGSVRESCAFGEASIDPQPLVAERQQVAGADLTPPDARAVDDRPVPRSQVLDDPSVVPEHEAGVLPGDAGVTQHDVAGLVTADQER